MTDKEKLPLSKSDWRKGLGELNCERAQAGHVLRGVRSAWGWHTRGRLPGSEETLQLALRGGKGKKKVQETKRDLEGREEKTGF